MKKKMSLRILCNLREKLNGEKKKTIKITSSKKSDHMKSTFSLLLYPSSSFLVYSLTKFTTFNLIFAKLSLRNLIAFHLHMLIMNV